MAKIITDVGLSIIAKRLKGLGTEPLYLAWGTGVNPPDHTDTALQTEDPSPGYARVAGVSQIITIGVADDTYQVSGSIVATAPLTITEWGVFDALVAGHLICREVQVPGKVLAIGGIINFIHKLQSSRCP